MVSLSLNGELRLLIKLEKMNNTKEDYFEREKEFDFEDEEGDYK